VNLQISGSPTTEHLMAGQYLQLPAIHARQSVFTITFRVITLELVYLVALVLVLLFLNISFSALLVNPILQGDYWLLLTSTLCVFSFIKIVTYIWISGRWMNIYYLIYSDRIVRNTGMFNHREKTYLLQGVAGIDLVQSFWGTMFNYGSLIMRDKNAAELFRLPDIHEPKRYQDLIGASIGMPPTAEV
jgi:ABC-type multidrug transport system fused ATPase/permease subunit